MTFLFICAWSPDDRFPCRLACGVIGDIMIASLVVKFRTRSQVLNARYADFEKQGGQMLGLDNKRQSLQKYQISTCRHCRPQGISTVDFVNTVRTTASTRETPRMLRIPFLKVHSHL